jgi:hypothetical protein
MNVKPDPLNLFRDWVHISKTTCYVSVTIINQSVLLKKTIADSSENNSKHINTLCGKCAKFLILLDESEMMWKEAFMA